MNQEYIDESFIYHNTFGSKTSDLDTASKIIKEGFQQGRNFLTKMQGNGVIAEDDTFSHFIELTIDQFYGAWVLYKHTMFIHLCDYTVEEALLDAMSQKKKKKKKARCEDI